MLSRAKKVSRDVAKLPSIPKELVDRFLTGPMTGEAINKAGVAFKKALIEASLNAELSHHLGYAPGADKPEQVSNHRNGSTSKTVLTGDGKVRIETPRDREGSFEPLLVPKHARRFTAFDDSIVALYARGLTVREIQGDLIETYGTEVSPDLISTVTDGVLSEVTAWQSRPLEPVYAAVFFDALRVKIREDNLVRRLPPIGGDVSQSQPDQLACRVVTRKMTPRLDDFPQAGIHTFNRIGGVDHPPDLRRKREERDHLRPGPPPGRNHGREFPPPFARLERIQCRLGGLGAGGGIDRAQRRGQRFAVLPTGVIEAVADQMHDARL